MASPASPVAGDTATGRWNQLTAWLAPSVVFGLSALGTFALGVSLALWLGLGASFSTVAPSPGSTPIVSQLAAARAQQGAPLADTEALIPSERAEPPAGPAAVLVIRPTTEPPPTVPEEPTLWVATIRAPAGFAAATVRANPSVSAPSRGYVPNGAHVEILAGTATADDFQWVRVRTADGVVGWVVALATTGV